MAEKPVCYICDPEKAVGCPKSQCYAKTGCDTACAHTFLSERAKLDKDGNPIPAPASSQLSDDISPEALDDVLKQIARCREQEARARRLKAVTEETHRLSQETHKDVVVTLICVTIAGVLHVLNAVIQVFLWWLKTR